MSEISNIRIFGGFGLSSQLKIRDINTSEGKRTDNNFGVTRFSAFTPNQT